MQAVNTYTVALKKHSIFTVHFQLINISFQIFFRFIIPVVFYANEDG